MIVGHPSYLLVEHTEGKATMNEREDFLNERDFQMYRKSRPQNCGVNVNSWNLVDKNLLFVCLLWSQA